MDIIQQGIDKGLITFDKGEDKKYITYVHQNKKRNYQNPEEKVQAETYLSLILNYGYPKENIRVIVPVSIGSSQAEADIVVYGDDSHSSAHIVVECKKEDVSELEFQRAFNQAFSYAATGTVRARYFWITSGIKDMYFQIPDKEPKKRMAIPDIPQYGINKLANHKYAKGGGRSPEGQRFFELEAVTEKELTQRFNRAHNALWGGGALNPSAAFDELNKLIFCKIWDENKKRKNGDAYDFQIFKESTEEKTNKSLYDRITSLYADGRKKDFELFKEDIRLSPEKLRTVVSYLESVNLGKTDLDSKGRAFETFTGSLFRGDFGQFFTPRPIVKFIVDVLPITNDSLVLDTCCGSGGFLLHALDKVRKEASEYHNEGTEKHYKHWHGFAEKNLFGIEINEQIARVAKMNMLIHDDGHTNVVTADGLCPIEEIVNETGNKGFKNNHFDFIITNPPFGSKIKLTERAYMNQYGYAFKPASWLDPKGRGNPRETQSSEVLFIEQCHGYLREGGYLAIVIPDGILTNYTLQYVREGIEEMYRIVAVISIPQTAFAATGAGVKCSVLFLKKHTKEITEQIESLKQTLQDDIKIKNSYSEQLEELEKQKNLKIKGLKGFNNEDNLGGKSLTKSDSYKIWRGEVTSQYKEKKEELKVNLVEEYEKEKRGKLEDYPMFMAIAEDIGYDATGRDTKNNELDIISEELAGFIETIEAENK